MSASSRPYLLRAIYEWLLDNNLTPHIVINTDMPGVEVPSSHIENGQLVLNISPDACRDLLMGDEEVIFSARFNGTPRQIRLPVEAVAAIYARENNQGMVFGQEPRLTIEADTRPATNAPVKSKLVEVSKSKEPKSKGFKVAESESETETSKSEVLKVEVIKSKAPSKTASKSADKPTGKKVSHLTVVK